MTRFLAAVFIAVTIASPAHAQFQTPPGTSIQTSDGQTIKVPISSAQFPSPAAIGGPIGSPTYVVKQNGGGVLDVGQAFGEAAPWINSVIGALLTAATSWIFYLLNRFFGINFDQKQRDSFQTAILNQASSLIADGVVKMEGKKVVIDNAAMATAVKDATTAVPQAVKYFNLTPETIAAKILDKIPQVPAGSTMISAGVATTLPPPEQAKPI